MAREQSAPPHLADSERFLPLHYSLEISKAGVFAQSPEPGWPVVLALACGEVLVVAATVVWSYRTRIAQRVGPRPSAAPASLKA